MDLVEKPLDWLHARSPYFLQNILTKKVLLVLREYPNSGTGPWVTIMLHKFNFLSQLFFYDELQHLDTILSTQPQ